MPRVARKKSGTITDEIYYRYGSDGIVGFKHNGKEYTYRKNVQGDITHIYNSENKLVVNYVYDAFGNHTDSTYAAEGYEFLAKLNPFRYRGYYYDTETGLYYLNSRYYDPSLGRFINADDISYAEPESINGLNLYAYCNNNPISNIDPDGHKWYEFWKWDWGKIAGWVATAALVVGAVVMIGLVAVGTVASGGLLAPVLVGAGVGILAGVGGSIVAQGGLTNIGNVNPWSVFTAGVIGGVIGAVSGAASFGLAQIGQAAGQSIGFALSNARHISSGVKIAKIFGLTTSTLMKAGFVVGGFAGGMVGGMAANYMANSLVTDTFGSQYTINNPNYVRSGLLKFFQWLNPLA